jgi:hypothetical protein
MIGATLGAIFCPPLRRCNFLSLSTPSMKLNPLRGTQRGTNPLNPLSYFSATHTCPHSHLDHLRNVPRQHLIWPCSPCKQLDIATAYLA